MTTPSGAAGAAETREFLTSRCAKVTLEQAGLNDSDEPIVDAVQQVAEARGVPMAQVALAWTFRNPA